MKHRKLPATYEVQSWIQQILRAIGVEMKSWRFENLKKHPGLAEKRKCQANNTKYYTYENIFRLKFSGLGGF